jgi:hypothetical protein
MAGKDKKDLAARLTESHANPYANRCSVGNLLRMLSPEDRNALESALFRVRQSLEKQDSLQTGYTARWLSRTVSEYGYKISDRMIRRHLHGDCSCES